MAALGAMLSDDGLLTAHGSGGRNRQQADVVNPLAPRPPHFDPKAKACIFIFMAGAPSHIDLFDPKPMLKRATWPTAARFDAGERPVCVHQKRQSTAARLTLQVPANMASAAWSLSELLPHLVECADDLLLVRSLHTEQFNHHPGQLMMQCGRGTFGLPTMGSWLTYGLGSESQNLPGYVVLNSGRGSSGGATLWQSGFLPSTYAGVLFRSQGEPVLNLTNPPGIPDQLQRKGSMRCATQTSSVMPKSMTPKSPPGSRPTNWPTACRPRPRN